MVIVGAGECGLRAGLALREEGYVGPVTLIGEERHLPYERPPLSKDILTDEQLLPPRIVRPTEALEAAGITLLLSSKAVSIDRAARRAMLGDGRALSYDKLLLATGARPRRLPQLDRLGERVLYLRGYDDAVALRGYLDRRSRLAVIGGGFIGLEAAAAARQRGAAVAVIEAQPRVLMRAVPAEIAEVVTARHAAAGVDLICGDGFAEIADTGNGLGISLTSGRRLEADAVLVGVGAVPETALAERSALAIDNGIAVDETLATSDPHIFAAGDCCSFPSPVYDGRRIRLEAWRNAQDQGALAAKNMLGAGLPIESAPWFWSDQFELTLQVAGIAEGATNVVRRDVAENAFILFHLAPDGRLLAASGIGPGGAVGRDVRIAEMLIMRRAIPDPRQLASPELRLKSLLAG
ncbi:MAG: FAD-dependent oxidoreductase [Rhizobiaceae bacterium]|nr:FAD-dependent oxidoreductase [Rhizobiaceae bacterium]